MARNPCEQCRESREVVLDLTVHWGDERGDWSGEKSFCSWAHAAEWLADMAVEHDAKPAAVSH